MPHLMENVARRAVYARRNGASVMGRAAHTGGGVVVRVYISFQVV